MHEMEVSTQSSHYPHMSARHLGLRAAQRAFIQKRIAAPPTPAAPPPSLSLTLPLPFPPLLQPMQQQSAMAYTLV